MNKTELDHLHELMSRPKMGTTVSICDVPFPKWSRTLLYGYGLLRWTYHTYVMEGELHHVISNSDCERIAHEHGVLRVADILPNKRLYPECCDAEFCRVLLERHGELTSFTTFNEFRQQADFYGLRHDQLTKGSLR